jgi:hypothetical protein
MLRLKRLKEKDALILMGLMEHGNIIANTKSAWLGGGRKVAVKFGFGLQQIVIQSHEKIGFL